MDTNEKDTGTASCNPEDHQHQPPPSNLEKGAVTLNKKSTGQSHKKTRSQRQKNRWARLLARTSISTPSDAAVNADEKLKIIGKDSNRQENNRGARILTRRPSGGDTQPPPSHSRQIGLLPSQEAEQDHEDEDEEDTTPGVVWEPGMNSRASIDFQEDDLTMTEEDSTNHFDETNEAINSTRMILEAELCFDEDSVRQAQIEEAARQRLLQELGQVPEAEVVEPKAENVEDHGSQTRRRVLLCAGIMVIISVIIIASVLATRSDDSPTTAPPTSNYICNEAHPIILGDAPIAASLEDAFEQVVFFCKVSAQSTQPGLWYTVRGVREMYDCMFDVDHSTHY